VVQWLRWQERLGQVLQSHELEFCSGMNWFQAFFELVEVAQTTERIFLLTSLLSSAYKYDQLFHMLILFFHATLVMQRNQT